MKIISDNQNVTPYERKVTPIERMFHHSPYSIVTLVTRVRGTVTEDMLVTAVAQVQARHPNLRVRIREDGDHNLWFTSEGVEEILVETVRRESEDYWIQVHQQFSKIPFEFEKRPAIRFVLVQSPEVSEIVILCHHILCDGMSLAYLARDLMVQLGDPAREVEVLPDPIPIEVNNMPADVSLNAVEKFFINRINKKWEAEEVFFDQEDYEDLNAAYWGNFTHQIISIELSETQTTALVQRCRKEGVTVNSALAAAFAGAQRTIQGDQPYHTNIGVAADLRDRLMKPAGEVMGFYAGLANLKYKYETSRSFWENARRFHQKVNPLYTNKILFKDLLTWCYLSPGILEAFPFKRLGGLVSPEAPRYQQLSGYSQQDDVVSSILKREKMDSLEYKLMGTAVTNLTRLDFPRQYGAFELDRMILQPGGAFPLVNINLVLGAVTCAGKLSLILEYAEEAVDSSTMEEIRDKGLEFLLGE
jgi:NRPS condensation-like uncharacterized protein